MNADPVRRGLSIGGGIGTDQKSRPCFVKAAYGGQLDRESRPHFVGIGRDPGHPGH